MIQILTSKNASKDFHTSKKYTSLFDIKGGPLPPQNQFTHLIGGSPTHIPSGYSIWRTSHWIHPLIILIKHSSIRLGKKEKEKNLLN
jgi:hypothetical protein